MPENTDRYAVGFYYCSKKRDKMQCYVLDFGISKCEVLMKNEKNGVQMLRLPAQWIFCMAGYGRKRASVYD
jgi:hypothetical protein